MLVHITITTLLTIYHTYQSCSLTNSARLTWVSAQCLLDNPLSVKSQTSLRLRNFRLLNLC